MSRLTVCFAALWVITGVANAQWTNLAHSPGFHLDTCLLLTNGDVMCHEYESPNWHRLRPDHTGSYKNGTWDSPTIASMPQGTDGSNVKGATCAPCNYGPLYFSSQVLKDGRVVVIGGEYNTNGNTWTNIGFMYTPSTDSWSAQLTEPFGTGNIGDAQSVVLKDGTMLLADISNGNVASFNPSTLTFTALGPGGKLDNNDEEGWTLLPNNQILVVDAGRNNSYEIYTPSPTNSWGNAGATAGLTLADVGGNCNSNELGPAVMRPDGTLIYFSGSTTGQNAVATISGTVFSHPANVDFPVISGAQYGAADAPASLLPDGQVLVMSSPVTCHTYTKADGTTGYTIFNSGSHFFQWDGTSLNQLATDADNSGSFISYNGRMLLLPSGEVLFTAYDQNKTDTAQLYSDGGSPQDAWRPQVDTSSLPFSLGLGTTYPVSGTQFNGFSLGATYGDDAQMSTNYPLVRITDHTGTVLFATTHDHSRMGTVTQPSSETVSTNFDVPTGLASGTGTLVVITNGIASLPVSVNIAPATSLTYTGATSGDYNDTATLSATLKSAGNPVQGETIQFTTTFGGSCSGVTDASGVASCTVTPTVAAGPYSGTASFTGDTNFGASSTSFSFTVMLEDTQLTITGPVTSDYHDAVTVVAHLIDPDDATVIPGKSVTFDLGTGAGHPTCSATTDASGNVSCSLTPNQAAGPYTLAATFTDNVFYKTATGSATFTVTKEETTIAFTAGSPTVIANGHPVTFSATLLEDGTTPPVPFGQTVTFTLGSGITAQTCNGTTDSTGLASCTIAIVNQPLGPNTVGVNFASDAYYLASSASEPVILFAFLAKGSMIIGNLDDATNTKVEFWGATWSAANSLTGGAAPDAFKGFADNSLQSCGGTWSTAPGNSSAPPASLPSYMGVIASTAASQSGSTISGDGPIIVVVKTNAGYSTNPGHPGTGTVVATYCHP